MAELTGKTISELSALSALSGGELFAVSASGNSRRMTAENLRKSLPLIGTNPTGGTANDTRENWLSYGTGIAYISGAGQLNNQPSTYGFIINIAYGTNVRQLFLSHPNGSVFSRGANTASEFDTTPWREMLDLLSFNFPSDFTSLINFAVTGSSVKATRQGRVCTIEYMSEERSDWEAAKTLFTLPVGYRPKVTTFFGGTLGAGMVPALVELNSSGAVSLNRASSYPTGVRVYLNFSYSCE